LRMTIRLLGAAQTGQLAEAAGSTTIPGLMQTQFLIERRDPRDMVKSCVWRSGGFLSCDDFVVVPDSVLEGDSSRDVG
jgi:hypothetical protein